MLASSCLCDELRRYGTPKGVIALVCASVCETLRQDNGWWDRTL